MQDPRINSALLRAPLLLALGLAALGCERPNPDEVLPPVVDADLPDLAEPGPPGPALLQVDDADFEFNPVQGAAQSLPRTFTITNVGGVPSGALVSEINGKDFGAFAISKDGCATVALGPGQSCAVSVVVLSSIAGSFDADLRVHGDPGGVAKTRLRGGVIDAGLAFGQPQVDFGSLVQEQQSVAVTLTLKNGGGATTGPLSLSTSAPSVSIVNDQCSGAKLAGGAACTVAVRFSAAFDAVGTSMITVLASGAPGGNAAILTQANVLTEATLDVPSFDFGTIGRFYGSPATHTLTVKNVGHTAATVISSQLTFSSSLSVTADQCKQALLAPNDTCTVTVRFDPRRGSDSSNLVMAVDKGHGATGKVKGTSKLDGVPVYIDLSQGLGSGTVLAMDGQLCTGPTTQKYCELFFPLTTGFITLTATPDAASTFDSWSGECTGSIHLSCMFVVPNDPTTIPVVIAKFNNKN